ncbi:hypothetical protein GHT06_003765 [Daphnia sinensis]|uniref:Uncharacterized protein n=1 Tax=Daphnia sinensis TaxID=1820382 RepID=A0AAD5KDP4_9CRUS|nr:hypothetical protein GHT06_003765 [Daphnia sinensis]
MLGLATLILWGLGALVPWAPAAHGHAAMLYPPQMPFSRDFVAALPKAMRAMTTHRESYGQDIPMYLLQTTHLEYWEQYGRGRRGGVWGQPCRVRVPTGKTYKFTVGRRIRVKTQTDVDHGGDFEFGFYRMAGAALSTADRLLGRAVRIKGAGSEVNSGRWDLVKCPPSSTCAGAARGATCGFRGGQASAWTGCTRTTWGARW